MKQLLGILLGLVLLSLASCVEQQPPIPTALGVKQSDFKILQENLRVTAGRLSIYKYGNDTIYIVEGHNSSSPVGVTLK